MSQPNGGCHKHSLRQPPFVPRPEVPGTFVLFFSADQKKKEESTHTHNRFQVCPLLLSFFRSPFCLLPVFLFDGKDTQTRHLLSPLPSLSSLSFPPYLDRQASLFPNTGLFGSFCVVLLVCMCVCVCVCMCVWSGLVQRQRAQHSKQQAAARVASRSGNQQQQPLSSESSPEQAFVCLGFVALMHEQCQQQRFTRGRFKHEQKGASHARKKSASTAASEPMHSEPQQTASCRSSLSFFLSFCLCCCVGC